MKKKEYKIEFIWYGIDWFNWKIYFSRDMWNKDLWYFNILGLLTIRKWFNEK